MGKVPKWIGQVVARLDRTKGPGIRLSTATQVFVRVLNRGGYSLYSAIPFEIPFELVEQGFPRLLDPLAYPTAFYSLLFAGCC